MASPVATRKSMPGFPIALVVLQAGQTLVVCISYEQRKCDVQLLCEELLPLLVQICNCNKCLIQAGTTKTTSAFNVIMKMQTTVDRKFWIDPSLSRHLDLP